jgi:hypothetical protein
MIAEAHTNDDESAYQREAERRLKLHRNNDSKKDEPGNRIRIIGYDGNAKYEDLDRLRSKPGDIVSRFNDKNQDKFSIFIHSPFKEHLTSATKDKNSTSIVFQARFKASKYDASFSGLFMFGGDSDHYSWDTILTKTTGKDKSESALNWDVFLSPHHCSWSFFNDRPQHKNPTPVETSLEALNYRNTGAKVIASSKKILKDEDNPPHDQAKQEYIKKVGSANFLNTETYEVVGKTPQPIVFEITAKGPAQPPKGNVGSAYGAAGGSGAASTIIKQG